MGSEGTGDDPEDNDVMIDNFAVKRIPSCPSPLVSSFDVTSATSASLTWTSVGSDSAWDRMGLIWIRNSSRFFKYAYSE